MSLQAAAQHLSSRGRGPDNTLVHMSRNEVKSLNDLALAHGGQLTINPQTGLPEAGFLSSILPMVAGAALAATGIGAPMAALLVGGGATAMTGSLKKGLMAGLGAYGGAGLGSSLMGAGAGATEAAASAIPEAAGSAASANPLAGLDMSGATTAGISPTAAAATPVAGPSPMISNALPAQGAFNPAQVTSMPSTNFAPSVNPTAMAQTPPVTATVQPELATNMYGGKQPYTPFEEGFQGTAPKPTFSENMASMKRGFTGENLMNYAKENPYQVAGMLAPALMQDEKGLTPYKGDADMGQRYTYSANKEDNPFPTPDPTGREQRYFTPTYTKISNEEAKRIYGYAGGGPIEQMSNQNAIGANTGYPMADINKGAYATPYQTPISRNVLSGAADTGVNPMTGEMNFAGGGITGQGNLNLQIPLDLGGGGGGSFGQQGANGYQAAGSGGGFGGGFGGGMLAPAVQRTGQFGQTNNQNLSGLLGLLGSLAERAQSGGTAPMQHAMYRPAIGMPGGQGGQTTYQNPNPQVGGPAQLGGNEFSTAPAVQPYSPSDARPTLLRPQMTMPYQPGGYGRFKEGGSVASYKDGGFHLGDYSDGGRLLRGPGDGVSDSIPAVIGKKQPARLADGEFVVPARIVSELGNGSTEAGARKLYAMMDRIQKARGKTVGKGKVAKNSRSEKYLPA